MAEINVPTHSETSTHHHATSHGAVKPAFDLMGLAPLGLVFVVFYFLVFRPQQKKMKQQREMLGSLKRGDKVVTSGGMVGTISKIVNAGDDEVMVEIADGLSARFARSAVTEILSKPGSKDASSEAAPKASKASTVPAKRSASRSSKPKRK